ncbi:MAG TPA: hypothetical protein VKR32_10720 [Puia sp.]|nr:hypothetical protein [Puia sp.]
MRACLIILILIGGIACTTTPISNTSNDQDVHVRDSVRAMMDTISRVISREGPVGWLRFFENSASFYMVSDGILVFPNYDTAKSFISNVLVKNIRSMSLNWNDVQIDPISGNFADVSAAFQEKITDTSGKTKQTGGYFTALAHQSGGGWKLHNAHWSEISKP